ncbi:hypothetical protein HYY75_02310 [bacterium]|nr:hypothetical protein [bacterium]
MNDMGKIVFGFNILSRIKELPLFRWISFCIVFWGLPIGLALNECEGILKEYELEAKSKIDDDIEEKTTKFDSESAILPGINLFFGLQRIFISSATSQIEAFQEMKRLGNEDFPGVLEFIFVNKDGELIKSLSDVHPPRELIKGFFQDYKASTLGDSSNLKKNISKYHSFLGPCIGEGFEINVIEGITAASYRMSRAYVYFSNCYSEGMFIALISLTQNLENLELVFRAKWHNFEIPESKTAFIDIEKPIANYSTEFGNLSPHLQYAISELESKPKGGVFAGGHLWKQQKISKRFCRITAIPFPRHVTVEKYSNYLLAFSCLLLCILSYKTWKVISGQDRLNFSIQHKLILLFLYVVGIPTLLLGISSQGFLRERKKVLEAAMYARQEKILMKFDQGLNEGIGNFELRLKEILDSPLHKEDSLLEVAQVRLNMILEKFSPGLCELVDETGSRRFSRKTTWGTNVNKMLEMITSRAPAVLGEINRIPQDQKENSKDQFLNMAAEFMGLNIELIFSSLFQDVGSLNEFKPSGGNLYIMLYPLKDQKRFARFLSFLVEQPLSLIPIFMIAWFQRIPSFLG